MSQEVSFIAKDRVKNETKRMDEANLIVGRWLPGVFKTTPGKKRMGGKPFFQFVEDLVAQNEYL